MNRMQFLRDDAPLPTTITVRNSVEDASAAQYVVSEVVSEGGGYVVGAEDERECDADQPGQVGGSGVC